MSFGDEWRSSSGSQADDFDPPDGPYHVKVIDASAFNARTDGRPYAKLLLQILGGELAGRRFEYFNGISHPVGRAIVRENLLALGLDETGIDDIEDLSRAMWELINTVADVTVGHKDGYRNLSVQGSRTGRSDIPNDPAPPPAPPAAAQQSFASALGGGAPAKDDDDPIPF